MPLISGIRTSRIKHASPSSWPELKNSAAEANDSALNPTDFRKLWRASRTDSSSSMTAIFGLSATSAFHLLQRRSAHRANVSHQANDDYVPYVGMPLARPPTPRARHRPIPEPLLVGRHRLNGSTHLKPCTRSNMKSVRILAVPLVLLVVACSHAQPAPPAAAE